MMYSFVTMIIYHRSNKVVQAVERYSNLRLWV